MTPSSWFALHLVLSLVKGVISGSDYNCSSFKNSDLPTVRVYDAAPAEPVYFENNTVTLILPENVERTFAWPGLECEHSKPVRWIYDNSYITSSMDETYTLTTRTAPDFYNESSYVYLAEVELKIRQRRQRLLFVCSGFENPCQRRVVEAVYLEEEELYRLRLLEKSEEQNVTVSAFIDKLVKSGAWRSTKKQGIRNETGNISASKCEVNFTFADYGSRVAYTFQPLGGLIDQRYSPGSQSLDNSYRFVDTVKPECVTKNDCFEHNLAYLTKCTNLTIEDTGLFRPLVFFMSIPGTNVSRLVRTFSIFAARNESSKAVRKLDWEQVDRREFLFMKSLPKQIALESDGNMTSAKINVLCRWTPYLFSVGARIGYQINGTNDTRPTILNEMETYEAKIDEDERRQLFSVSGELQILVENKTRTNVEVFCFVPVWNSSEWVNVSRTVELIRPSIEVYGNSKPLVVLPVGSSYNASCKAKGPPLPNLEIIPPQNVTRISVTKDDSLDSVVAQISWTNVDESHSGNYSCLGSSSVGTTSYHFEIRVERPTSEVGPSRTGVILISVLSAGAALLVAVVGLLFLKFWVDKAQFSRLTEEAILEFLEGVDTQPTMPTESTPRGHVYANDSVKALPYDKKFEVPYKHWTFDDSLLGAGATGVVRKGTVRVGKTNSIVAVKSVKSPESIECFRAALLELKIMSYIGHHENIVKLIAASTEDIHNRQVFIAVEFCANGSLLDFLRRNKESFKNLVVDGRLLETPNEEEPTYMNVEECREARSNYGNTEMTKTINLSTLDLLKWSSQIASGMEFLEARKVLHADLAARNILLNEFLNAKISDFGLSRELFENSEYTKNTHVALPWKWMAIESLRYFKFSTKSDVWSYGVTLHEIFSLGEEPYLGQTWTEEFMQALESDMRLCQPPLCTDIIYNDVMLECWRKVPSHRITFADAVAILGKEIKP